MREVAGHDSTAATGPAQAVRRQIRILAGLLVGVNVLLPVVLYVGSRLLQTEYWRMFDGEDTAVNWISSVQLVFLAVVAWLNYQALSLLRRLDPARVYRYRSAWLLFAAGFFFLALDECFGYHEWLGAHWPPGRYALAVALAVGVAASPLLIGHLRRRPAALALYAAGLLLTLWTVIICTTDESTRYAWTHWYFWDYSFEELAELWAQVLFALAFLRVLYAQAGAIGRAAGRLPGGGDVLVADARRQLELFGGAMLLFNLTLPVGFAVYSVVTGESFYELFWGETDAISWFSSLQLMAVGFVAWFVCHAEWLAGRAAGAASQGRLRLPRGWIWFVFSLGFLFLSLDERFEWHELMRDDVLQPEGLFTGIPGIESGDVVLYFYLALGLVFTAFLVRELRAERLSLALFVAALCLSAVIVVEDSLTPEVRGRLPFPGFWDSAFEEVGEIWTQFLFLCSFLVFLYRRLPSAALPAGEAPAAVPLVLVEPASDGAH